MPNLSDRMLTLLGCHEVHTCKIPDVYLVYNVSKFSLAARSTSILTNTRITLLLVLRDYVRPQPPIEVVSCKSIHCSKLRKKFSTQFNFRRKGFFGCFQFKYWAGRFIKVQVLFEYDFRPPKRSELWYIPEYFTGNKRFTNMPWVKSPEKEAMSGFEVEGVPVYLYLCISSI